MTMAHRMKGHAYVNYARTVNIINNFTPTSRSSSPVSRYAADSHAPSAHSVSRSPINASRSQSPARFDRALLPQGRGFMHAYPHAPPENNAQFIVDGHGSRRWMGKKWTYGLRKDGLYGKHHLADRPEPPDLPGERKEYKDIMGRISRKLPLSMKLSRDEKIHNLPTKLCYGEAKKPLRCNHFTVAREVRKCEEERRKLKHMHRMWEVCGILNPLIWKYLMSCANPDRLFFLSSNRFGMAQEMADEINELENDNYRPETRARDQTYKEALQTIKDCDCRLRELDRMKGPQDEERKRVIWRKEVACRRMKTVFEMDYIDEQIAEAQQDD